MVILGAWTEKEVRRGVCPTVVAEMEKKDVALSSKSAPGVQDEGGEETSLPNCSVFLDSFRFI